MALNAARAGCVTSRRCARRDRVEPLPGSTPALTIRAAPQTDGHNLADPDMFELSDPRRDELVERWATRITDRGLGTTAVFLLEAHKPLAGISAQLLLGFRPVVEALLRIDATELAAFVRYRDNIERLVLRIEELDHHRRNRQKK